ncbi:MAG: hypothetical protein K6E34_05945 [Lachnospiraceae bacterium]|nr:hypothetical protein [Lachnospiraceae bacterium]
MNKASINNSIFSFHSTAEFGRGYYRNHCGPTALTNLVVTALQKQQGRKLPEEEIKEIFEKTASLGRRRLIYNRRYGTTDLFLWFYARAVFKNNGVSGLLHPAARHTISGKNARQILSKGSYILIELFGHPKYGWHQMVIYDTDENGRFITADGFSSEPVFLDDNTIGRGLFLEIKHLS